MREIAWAGIRIKTEGMRNVEITFWRESQDLVIDKKWEGSEREVWVLCITLNKNCGDMIITVVHVKVEMPMTHLWENVE